MCGISGMLRFDGKPINKTELEKIGKTLHHRGPDHFGIYEDGCFGFAHNRLSIIDLSEAANQPFEDHKHLLVFNGEIYNYLELRKELESEYHFKTTSDTEVLFAALQKWGIDETLEHIAGMYAFAYFDKETKDTILVRDRFGIKPLYYYYNSTELIFASEAKGIWAVRDIKTDRIKTIFSIYGSGESDFNHTVFDKLHSMKPGYYLYIKGNGQMQETCYYDIEDLPEESLYNRYSNMSRDDIQAEYYSLMDDGIKSMLASDAPVGSLVSGGIDSSIITALARKYKDVSLYTSNVKEYGSELQYAQMVADRVGSKLNVVDFSRSDYINQITKATWHYECPIVSHVNALPMANVSQLAHDSGVKVVLTGEGSDELFLGYPVILFNKYKNVAMFPFNVLQRIYKLVPGLGSVLPGGERNVLSLMNTDFYRQRQRQSFVGKTAYLSKNDKEMTYQSVFMFKELLLGLLHRNDRMAMMTSIEARFPFLYEPLVKFAMNLPVKYKYRRTASIYNIKHPFIIDKSLVRDTAVKYLPKELVYRKKWGFGTDAAFHLSAKPGFFTNGYLAETMKMDPSSEKFMLEKTDKYTVSKLVAIELFGRMYEYRQPLEDLQSHCSRYLSMA